MDPPNDRKNVTPEVATPRSRYSEVLCTMIVRICMHRPRPTPKTSRSAESTQNDVVGPSRDSRKRPMAISAEPEIGKILYLPVLPTIVPAAVEATHRPTTIGSVRRPDDVALTPRTYCREVGRNVIAPTMAKPTTRAM